MIIGPPAGDAFNFGSYHLNNQTPRRACLLTPVIKIVVDLAVYPGNIFNFLIAFGLILLRQRRKALNLPPPDFKAWSVAVGFTLLANAYMLIAPWYPPIGGANGGDVSFWYGTYLAVSIGL